MVKIDFFFGAVSVFSDSWSDEKRHPKSPQYFGCQKFKLNNANKRKQEL